MTRFVKEWGLAPPVIVAVAIVIAAVMAWQVTAYRLDALDAKVDANAQSLYALDAKVDANAQSLSRIESKIDGNGGFTTAIKPD